MLLWRKKVFYIYSIKISYNHILFSIATPYMGKNIPDITNENPPFYIQLSITYFTLFSFVTWTTQFTNIIIPLCVTKLKSLAFYLF